MTENRENPSSPTPQSPEPQVDSGRMNARRRQLLRSGLAVAPAVLALKATPVMACNCKQPSGFSVSGNLSRNGGKACAAPGRRPSQWTPTSGYYAGVLGTKKVSALKGTVTLTTTAFSIVAGSANDKTVSSALAGGDSDLLALFIAVYLEAKATGGAYYPSTDMVVLMWNQTVATTVGYRPTGAATPVWQKSEVTKYLLYLTGQAL
ncbi:hypothetical protein [Roseateles sp. P5_E7]